jgi:hypothetical protein
MTLAFKSSQGKAYFIKAKLTKKGNRSYFLTTKKDDACLNEMPQGYEVFEKYDSGMMFIRKSKKSNFEPEALAIIERELTQNDSISDYKLDVNGNEVTVYILASGRPGGTAQNRFAEPDRDSFFNQGFRGRYEAAMRIKLHLSKSEREVEFMRYCYRGSVDDWITVGGGNDFKALAKEFLYHLGKDSYYDLIGF